MAPKVEPWYPPHRAMIFSFPVAMRASLIAPSFASAPLVEKYDFVDVSRRDFGQKLRQSRFGFSGEGRRRVLQRSGLLRDGIRHALVPMSQIAEHELRGKIEILFAGAVVEVVAGSALDDYRAQSLLSHPGIEDVLYLVLFDDVRIKTTFVLSIAVLLPPVQE